VKQKGLHKQKPECGGVTEKGMKRKALQKQKTKLLRRTPAIRSPQKMLARARG
jgi:hypothetical protein